MSNIFIFRGIDFELGYSDYSLTRKQFGISELLNDKKYKPHSGDFSYRIINHWESNELLSSSRNNGSGWRKYSVMDLVWLNIIRDMRDFGISLEQIRKVMDNLTEKDKKGNLLFPLLEYYMSISLTNRPVYLLVFSSGQAHPVTEKEYQSNREYSSNNNHMQVNLNNIIQRIFPNKALEVKFKEIHDYNMDERKVVQLIRFGAFENLTISLTNGSKQSISPKENDQFENMITYIFKKNYNRIEISLQNGKKLDFVNDVILIADQPAR